MGAIVLKLNTGLLFAQKLVNINVSTTPVPKLALVPASLYNCDMK